LRKRLPIFVHSRLPGQEEINLQYLKQQGLVFKLNQKTPFEKQLLSILKDQKKMKKWNTSIESYHKEIELEKPEGIVEVMKLILNLNQNGTPSYLARHPKLLYS
jgi:UDP-N-acetylglucosamine:LPS N-acetylglucosamine transferase